MKYLFDLPNDFKKKAKSMQDIESSMWLWFEELIERQFEYKGLPEEIPFYALEKALFLRGSGVMFKVSDNYLVIPCAMTGGLNVYGQPTRVQGIGWNGQSTKTALVVEDEYDTEFNIVNQRNAVYIRNNEQALPTYAILKPYMNRLMFIWQSLGIHECMTRVKMLIHANKDVAQSMKNQLEAMFSGSSPVAIVMDKKYDSETMETIDFNIEYKPQDFWDDFDNTLNMMLTICGINNDNSDKKERLIVDEVNANNALIDVSLKTRLLFREDACKKINNLFGLNVSVTCPTLEAQKSKYENETTSLKQDPPYQKEEK